MTLYMHILQKGFGVKDAQPFIMTPPPGQGQQGPPQPGDPTAQPQEALPPGQQPQGPPPDQQLPAPDQGPQPPMDPNQLPPQLMAALMNGNGGPPPPMGPGM
jgi:hypothetical protein